MTKLISLLLLFGSLLLAVPAQAQLCSGQLAVCPGRVASGMPLISSGRSTLVITDDKVIGAARAISALRQDLRRVSGEDRSGPPHVRTSMDVVIIVGTLGQSPTIDKLARDGKLDVAAIRGKWEAYVHALVPNPGGGSKQALVIAGSDKRGTIFGIYDLSRKIGVSPWHWWADVPVRRSRYLTILPGTLSEAPKVKYRGIFINDEEPALGPWARETFGGINAAFYEKVGELILRQRGNYLWPAMWGKSYFEDDPKTAALLHEMGVVVGTPHQEPLMRAHVDWEKAKGGVADYTTNAAKLRDFRRKGMERTQGQEKLVTVGMRGDGDEPMTEGTATTLLERMVADQRKIIAEVTKRPQRATPQLRALYKEVQDYYDKGMKVPDDVTLLFADDNWGNIRRLPEPGAKRAGGYGVYYHFDYGGPRNYKWHNTNQIERTWEQMNLAWHHGVDRLWIVNVGDIKPMEFPISFFLDHAWNPDAIGIPELTAYPAKWAAEQFGPQHAGEIGALLTRYTQYNSRRKPELITPETFDLYNGEADRVVAQWSALVARAERVETLLPAQMHDAYFQLVLHPIQASANLNELYVTVGKNRRAAAERGLTEANALAERAEQLYARHQQLRRRYEQDTAGGKWKHMMSQAVFGYTSWQQPDVETMPEVRRVAAGDSTIVLGGTQIRAPATPATRARQGIGFQERNGIIAVEAISARKVAAHGIGWHTIPNLGRTIGGVTVFPVTAPAQQPGRGPVLEFPVNLLGPGQVEVQTLLSPTLDYRGKGGHRFAIAFDDATPQIVNVNGGTTEAQWNEAVAQNAWIKTTRHGDLAPGQHVLRIWMIDPGLVFQRIHVIRPPAAKLGYLGPPESLRR